MFNIFVVAIFRFILLLIIDCLQFVSMVRKGLSQLLLALWISIHLFLYFYVLFYIVLFHFVFQSFGWPCGFLVFSFGRQTGDVFLCQAFFT